MMALGELGLDFLPLDKNLVRVCLDVSFSSGSIFIPSSKRRYRLCGQIPTDEDESKAVGLAALQLTSDLLFRSVSGTESSLFYNGGI